MDVHPLTDRIWDVRQGQFIDYAVLLDNATEAQHLLLGEVHINPEHHRIQAQILQDLITNDRSHAMAFEIFERDQQDAIDGVQSGARATSADIAAATGIEDSGWDWESYEPLVRIALENDIPILAANATSQEARQTARDGVAALPAARQAALGLSVPLPASAHAALAKVIVDSHCGYVFGDMTEGLIQAQRLRDATMADVMLGAPAGSTVLITGAGHARRDYGVPAYLLDRAPSVRVLSIGLTEVAAGLISPADYLDPLEGLDVGFDYLWFTPRSLFEDPCEQFKEHLETMRSGAAGEYEDATEEQ
jgi:uncharacterized iron-regulated protein